MGKKPSPKTVESARRAARRWRREGGTAAGFRLLIEDELKRPLRRGKQRDWVTYKDDQRIVRMLPTHCEKRKLESGLTETEAIREVVLRLPQTRRGKTISVDNAVRRLRRKMKAQPTSPLKHHLMFLPPPPVEAKQAKQRNKRR